MYIDKRELLDERMEDYLMHRWLMANLKDI